MGLNSRRKRLPILLRKGIRYFHYNFAPQEDQRKMVFCLFMMCLRKVRSKQSDLKANIKLENVRDTFSDFEFHIFHNTYMKGDENTCGG